MKEIKMSMLLKKMEKLKWCGDEKNVIKICRVVFMKIQCVFII